MNIIDYLLYFAFGGVCVLSGVGLCFFIFKMIQSYRYGDDGLITQRLIADKNKNSNYITQQHTNQRRYNTYDGEVDIFEL